MKLDRTGRQSAWMLAGGLLMLAACSPEPERPIATGKSGEELFSENCAACHGQGMGPSLEHLRSLSEDDLRAGIMNHPTAGEIQERLRADRVDRLIKYLEEKN